MFNVKKCTKIEKITIAIDQASLNPSYTCKSAVC